MSLLRRSLLRCPPGLVAVLLACLPGWLAPSSAQAACLICICSAGLVTPVSFGNYTPSNVASVDLAGAISFSCLAVTTTTTVGYDIRLSAGGANAFTPRSMAGPLGSSTRLQYNLFTGMDRSTVWGDGTGGSSFVSDSGTVGLLGFSRNHTVYARLPAGQFVQSGVYTDTIIVTVTY